LDYQGNSMRFSLHFTVKAIIISGLLTHGAVAQTSGQANGQATGQPAGQSAAASKLGQPASATVPPELVNAGTLAESAETTALETSTYHQPTGFLPGMKP
jgi:hypothetical protein